MPHKQGKAENVRLSGPVLLTAEKQRSIPLPAVEAAVLLLYLYGVLSTFSLTIDWTPPLSVILGTAFFGLAFVGILHLPSPFRGGDKKNRGWFRWAVFGGALLLLAGIAFFQRHSLVLGAQRFWLDLVDTLNQFYGTQYSAMVPLAAYRVSRGGSGPAVLFTMAVVSTLAAALSLFLTRGKGLIPFLLLSAPFLWMAVNLAKFPLGRPCLLFLAALLLVIGMCINRAPHAPAKQEGDFSCSRGWRSTRRMNRLPKGREQMFGGALAVTALGMAVVTAVVFLLPRERYVWSEKPQEIVMDAAQKVGERLSSRFDRVEGLLPLEVPMGGGMSGGRMGGVSEIRYTYEEKLRIENLGDVTSVGIADMQPLSKPETIYLRGYIGSVYANDHWEDLPAEVYPKDGIQNLEYIGWGGLGILPLPDTRLLSAAIRNISAGTEYLYHPYALYSTEEDIIRSQHLDSWISGYNPLREQPLLDSQVYHASFLYNPLILAGSPAAEILDEQEENTRAFREASEQAELWEMSDSEMAYREFVYANYRNIPDTLSLFRETYPASYYDGLSISQVADKVWADLRRCQYSLSPGKTPWYSDFVEDFLFSRRQGFCVHFAAAGTLMFRAAGIPSRYVEGYVARAGDYSDDYRTITLRDNAAHAWVEIYVAPFGWIPVEVTPGFAPSTGGQGTASSQPEAAASSSEAAVSSQPVSSNPASSQPVSSAPASSAAVSQDADENRTEAEFSMPVAVWMSLLAVALLVIGVWLRHILSTGQRNQALRQDDKRKAAIAGYRYLEQLLRFAGISAADGQSPQEFAAYAEEHCKFLEPGEFQTVTEAALSARFGGGTFISDQARPILVLARRLDRRIWDSLTPWKRFFYRYWNNL